MEQAVQLADQYWTANSHGDRREFRRIELMPAEGRLKWLSCPESPAVCQKTYAARAWVTAARARRFRTGRCGCPQLRVSSHSRYGVARRLPGWASLFHVVRNG